MKVITINKMIAGCLLTVLSLAIIKCGTVASVRPLGKGKNSFALSSGGPVAPVFDIKMPIPYSVLRYRRGLNENTDFHFSIHPTMMILGNLGLDIGITKQVMLQTGLKPALSLEGSIYGFYHMNELSSIRAYPEISFIGSYKLSEREHMLYFGVHNMVQCAQPYLVFALFVGLEIPIGNKVVINLEAKWYAPSEDSEYCVVDYTIKPVEHGAVGFVWGLSYRF